MEKSNIRKNKEIGCAFTIKVPPLSEFTHTKFDVSLIPGNPNTVLIRTPQMAESHTITILPFL